MAHGHKRLSPFTPAHVLEYCLVKASRPCQFNPTYVYFLFYMHYIPLLYLYIINIFCPGGGVILPSAPFMLVVKNCTRFTQPFLMAVSYEREGKTGVKRVNYVSKRYINMSNWKFANVD